MINIRSLSKSYGNHTVLNNITLNFKRGEINGIVGENGAGKTTLFKCIAGLENFNGSIDFTDGVLKDQTAYLPSDPYFLSKITGNEYLRLMCNARAIDMNNMAERNIFDLPLNEYAENYSTGMKKKLAITGLLIQKNEIYILDEPFNGVDIHSNIVLQEIILKLKQLNKIVIMSSHIFSTLEQTCDHLHHLKGGIINQSVGKEDFKIIEDSMRDGGMAVKIDRIFI
jgi:ABC-2 type transport system ATP-binding protein